MSDVIIVGLLAFLGTALTTIGGILATNKLVNFRLDKIEAKVEKHNNLVERVYCAEKDIRVLQQKTEDF